MASVVKSYDAWWVLMHNSRLMTERQPNIAYTVCAALNKRRDYAYSQGCKKLIVDPGIGFGKKGLENVALTKQLDKLQWFEVPILYGCSRKKFIGGITGVEDANQRVVGTEYCNAIALAMGANILRVHDVKSARRSIKMHEAFYGA
jgi:dihydropteroate synthase